MQAQRFCQRLPAPLAALVQFPMAVRAGRRSVFRCVGSGAGQVHDVMRLEERKAVVVIGLGGIMAGLAAPAPAPAIAQWIYVTRRFVVAVWGVSRGEILSARFRREGVDIRQTKGVWRQCALCQMYAAAKAPAAMPCQLSPWD